MFKKNLVDRPLRTAQQLLGVLDQIARSYPVEERAKMRWVDKYRGTIELWIKQLESANCTEDINDLWREVQYMGRYLDYASIEEVGKQYNALCDRFFNDVLEAVAEARRK